VIFVGVDWAEAHHDVAVMDEAGGILGRGRFGVGVAGLAGLHGLVADHAQKPEEVVVGIEIDRGLVVDSLVGAGYAVYGLNPLSVARYRERHTSSGATSDAGDAKLLADLVRTDRHNHHPLAGDSGYHDAFRARGKTHRQARVLAGVPRDRRLAPGPAALMIRPGERRRDAACRAGSQGTRRIGRMTGVVGRPPWRPRAPSA
jgi:hypothetical protein